MQAGKTKEQNPTFQAVEGSLDGFLSEAGDFME
jgi:hypothetical protein